MIYKILHTYAPAYTYVYSNAEKGNNVITLSYILNH